MISAIGEGALNYFKFQLVIVKLFIAIFQFG